MSNMYRSILERCVYVDPRPPIPLEPSRFHRAPKIVWTTLFWLAERHNRNYCYCYSNLLHFHYIKLFTLKVSNNLGFQSSVWAIRYIVMQSFNLKWDSDLIDNTFGTIFELLFAFFFSSRLFPSSLDSSPLCLAVI